MCYFGRYQLPIIEGQLIKLYTVKVQVSTADCPHLPEFSEKADEPGWRFSVLMQKWWQYSPILMYVCKVIGKA